MEQKLDSRLRGNNSVAQELNPIGIKQPLADTSIDFKIKEPAIIRGADKLSR
jgi:hypothetical protein